MRRLTLIPLILLAMLVLMGGSSCGESEEGKQRNASISQRGKAFSRAEKRFPLPQTVNFPLREALVKMTQREDLPNHPWYVYLIADTGNTIGYYVAQHSPVNSCSFLSSTEDVETAYEGTIVLTAPSLDGIFYGGGGSSANCDSWFFFDAATDAMVRIRGMDFYVSEAPLNLDAKAIKVERKK
jgi:hypothetical protein